MFFDAQIGVLQPQKVTARFRAAKTSLATSIWTLWTLWTYFDIEL
jgi:hypothetical protein